MSQTERSTVLITGARTGIGRACAEALAQSGYRVYGTSRHPPREEAPPFKWLPMDVDDSASVDDGIAQIVAETGGLDVVVNNAGFGYGGAIEDTSVEEAKALFETNFFGVLRVCRAVLPVMRRQGHGLIVNISSIGGVMGLPYQGMYSATKFALEGMSEALRLEVKPFGVHVVLIEPGDVRTSFTENRRHTLASQTSPVYRDLYHRVLAKIEADERGGIAPEAVARLLLRVVRRRSPAPRYVVGPFYEQLAVWAKRWLPARAFEWLLMKNYNL